MVQEAGDTEGALAALERFVVENDDLLNLEERIGRFNIFDALGIARAEIRHSNFLAWLLNPAESHGQGSLFLKAVLMDLFRQTPQDMRPLNPVELDGEELRGVELRREWRNIDLIISCHQPKFVIAIENKIGASLHNDLNKYESAVREGFPDHPPLFVLLSAERVEPDDDDWVRYGYRELYCVLDRVRRAGRGAIGDDVRTFLDHYLTLIGSRFMDNPQIDAMCRKIYTNHRQAIDLIISRARVGSDWVLSRMLGYLESRADAWEVTKRGKEEIRFVPKSWNRVLPPLRNTRGSRKSGWVACYLWCNDGYLEFSVWVLKTTDPAVQKRVTQRLTKSPEEFGFSMPTRRTRYSEEWTPILQEKIEEWDPDGEFDEDAIVAKATKRVDQVHALSLRVADAIREAVSA